MRKARHGRKPAVLEEQAPPIATGTQVYTQKATGRCSEKLASLKDFVGLVTGDNS